MCCYLHVQHIHFWVPVCFLNLHLGEPANPHKYLIYHYNACIIQITNRLVLLLIRISLIALRTEPVSEVMFVLYFGSALLEGTRLQTTCAFQSQSNSGFKLLTLSKGIKTKLYNAMLSCCSALVVRRGSSWIINLHLKSQAPFYFLALYWALNTVPTQTHGVVDV